MSAISFEIIFILLLLVANGVFAMSEIALVSARKSRLRQRAETGDARARAALELAESPDRFLSTVQIGITLVGIFAGAFGGATLAAAVAEQVAGVAVLAPYSEAIGLGVVVIAITYLSLIIGELVPKRIALNNPETIAALMARPMSLLSRLTAPVVYLLTFSTAVVLKLLRVKPSVEPPVTEEEVRALITQGAEAGVFERSEREIVESVLRLDDRGVNFLMTPRREVVWLGADASAEEIRRTITENQYSRFPVCEGSLDNVVGIVKAKNLLERCLNNEPLDLRRAMTAPLFVPETLTALEVLEIFKNAHTHTALVIDEHGGVEGLVTVNDVLEAIVGEMRNGAAEDLTVAREDGSYLLDGALPIDEFAGIFNVESILGDERGNYHTLAGFVLARLGHIPQTGDVFEWQKLRFEIVDMDGRRVDKVLVGAATAATAAQNKVAAI
jgi:putative hemolysin